MEIKFQVLEGLTDFMEICTNFKTDWHKFINTH